MTGRDPGSLPDPSAEGAVDWQAVLDGLAATGWTARVVPVERLQDVRERVTHAAATGEFPAAVAGSLARLAAFELPETPSPVRSVVVGATPRPLTQALLHTDRRELLVQVPPHYAGYYTTPGTLEAAVRAALAPFGRSAASFEPPLKTLAACSGLARYGRNNLAYVEGLGSYLCLGACVSDAPPPADHYWLYPVGLDHCGICGACRKACPTGAIRGERFLLHTDRCLTYHNERTEPFPDWIEPCWHHTPIGCLRCQRVCPMNADHGPQEDPPVVFDERETAAILAATPPADLPEETRDKMRRCGLDYSPQLIARNLRALLDADRS